MILYPTSIIFPGHEAQPNFTHCLSQQDLFEWQRSPFSLNFGNFIRISLYSHLLANYSLPSITLAFGKERHMENTVFGELRQYNHIA